LSKVAYIFPGQGSQYVEMGLDLYDKFSSAKEIFDRADEVLGFPLSKLCFEGPEDELTLTMNAQPALLTMSFACLFTARRKIPDILPPADFVAGHSLGEYTALTAAGAISFDTAVRLAHIRGQLMYNSGKETIGTMAAIIGMEQLELRNICKETGVWMANINCPGQIVISGDVEGIANASKLAKERGAKLAMPLQVSGAFHSPLMQSAEDNFADILSEQEIKIPDIPIIGNTRAQIIDSSGEVRSELMAQLCGCVQWQKTVEVLLEKGVTTFIEIGPGDVLGGMIRRINKEVKILKIEDVNDILNFSYS